MADGLKITCSRLKRPNGERFKITNTPKKTAEQQISPSLVKGTSVLKMTEKVGKVSDTPSKRKDISPISLKVEREGTLKAERRSQSKMRLVTESETDLPEADQEAKDPACQQAVTSKTKKKKKAAAVLAECFLKEN